MDPTERALRLLSLLQAHRHWSGRELTRELGVSARTLRRDVERLRGLGYPINASPGVDGGYRLSAGTHLPPLLLDDEEVVAIAVGVRMAATEAVTGFEDTALSALAKLEQLLPDRLRRRVEAVSQALTPSRWRGGEAAFVDAGLLGVLALAVRDTERVRFRYRRGDGETSRRDVEPHGIVSQDRRWYLVAWDLGRQAWRTFRLDRLDEVQPTGVRFRMRQVPAGDPAAYVAQAQTRIAAANVVTVRVEASAAAVQRAVSWEELDLDPIGPDASRVRLRGDSVDWVALAVATLAAFFQITVERAEPPEVVERLVSLGRQLGA